MVETNKKKEVEDVAEKVMSADFSGIRKYKLSRPVKVADKTYSEIALDFDSLTGEDMDTIVATMTANAGGLELNINEFNKIYQKHIVARAAKITYHELNKFPLPDIASLTLAAQSFLLSAASNLSEK